MTGRYSFWPEGTAEPDTGELFTPPADPQATMAEVRRQLGYDEPQQQPDTHPGVHELAEDLGLG